MLRDMDEKIAVASAAKKIRDDSKIAEEDKATAKMLRDMDEKIAVASAAKKIRDDNKSVNYISLLPYIVDTLIG